MKTVRGEGIALFVLPKLVLVLWSGIYITVTGSTRQQFSGTPSSPSQPAHYAMRQRLHHLAAGASELIERSEKG
jgi:hypothetical protein